VKPGRRLICHCRPIPEKEDWLTMAVAFFIVMDLEGISVGEIVRGVLCRNTELYEK